MYKQVHMILLMKKRSTIFEYDIRRTTYKQEFFLKILLLNFS